jgi:hypothetical protein
MKKVYQFLALSIVTINSCFAQEDEKGFRGAEFMGAIVPDPVAYHSYLYRLDKGDKFKNIMVDLNGDGVKDYLFVDLESYTEDQKLKLPSSWDVYLSQASGKFLCVKDTSGLRLLPSLFYVGIIEELNGKKGVITIQTESPREGDPVSHIYATTIEVDGSLKEQLLVTFPAAQASVLFDKYLSEQKITTVIVEEKQK